ncbi:MAG: hypothetical protein JKY52_01435 [Flavobacteriales bacterium]|nr:hypothetical protein [Flavobacteriales bacterium]
MNPSATSDFDLNLKNVVVQFELPFMLRVVDAIKMETRRDEYQEYVFQINGIPAMVRFEKKLKENGGMGVATEDRRGLLSNSIVQVWFDKQFFKVYKVDQYKKHAQLFMAASVMYVNKFTEKYAEVTKSFWIYPVSVKDTALFNLIGRYKDGTDDPFHYGTLGTGLGLGSLLTQDQDRQLREDLAQNRPLDNIQKLAFTARDHLEGGDYWMASLTIEIVFESKFARILNIAFTNQGLSTQDVEGKFQLRHGYPRSITNLVKTYLRDLACLQVEETSCVLHQEYINWCHDARDLRNDIAHGITLNISQNQAINSFNAIKNFLNAIEPHLPDESHTEILI